MGLSQISLSTEALLRLVRRLQIEYGETSCSNFALDEQLNEIRIENERLAKVLTEKEAVIASLVDRAQQAEKDCELLREQIDPKRAGRFRGPHKGLIDGTDQDKSS